MRLSQIFTIHNHRLYSRIFSWHPNVNVFIACKIWWQWRQHEKNHQEGKGQEMPWLVLSLVLYRSNLVQNWGINTAGCSPQIYKHSHWQTQAVECLYLITTCADKNKLVWKRTICNISLCISFHPPVVVYQLTSYLAPSSPCWKD